MLGGRVRIRIDGPMPVAVEVIAAGAAALRLAEGAEVWASVKASEVPLTPLWAIRCRSAQDPGVRRHDRRRC